MPRFTPPPKKKEATWTMQDRLQEPVGLLVTRTDNPQNLNVPNCKFAGLKTPMPFQGTVMHFFYNDQGLLPRSLNHDLVAD